MTRKVLPQWFVEALEGEPTDHVLNKRKDTRHQWMMMARIEFVATSEKKTVKVFNTSTDGIGFISREPIAVGELVKISPDYTAEDGTPFEPIEAETAYCTQTIQGYKIGCSFR